MMMVWFNKRNYPLLDSGKLNTSPRRGNKHVMLQQRTVKSDVFQVVRAQNVSYHNGLGDASRQLAKTGVT
jgi:hypothetical protein